jgi:hypothetical protein
MSAGRVIGCIVIGLIAVIVLIVTDYQISHRTEVTLYENEMMDRFAFDPDVQPQSECVQNGRTYVGEWNLIKEHPHAGIGTLWRDAVIYST